MVETYHRRWLAAFGVTLALLAGAAILLNWRIPSFRDPPFDFYSMTPGEFVSVHALTRRQEAALKLGFAESFAPPEIGVFGNHIIENFSSKAFGRPDDTAYFFNYAYANLALPEIYRYLRHLESRKRLPRTLLLVQITPPNDDNGQFIITWGNELPLDLLLSGIVEEGPTKDFSQIGRLAWELVSNSLHEVLNYNSLLLGVLQGRANDRVVDPNACQRATPAWFGRLPFTLQSLIGPPLGQSIFCFRRTWSNAYRPDGSVDPYLREDENAPIPPAVLNNGPIDATNRGLKAGDERQIARDIQAIDAVGRRNGLKVVFLVTPVYETEERKNSVVNQIFDRALSLIPEVTMIDHRGMRGDPALVTGPLNHPMPKYFNILVEELRRRGFVD